jgi:cobalamin biosynthesis Mg chelatase CobN
MAEPISEDELMNQIGETALKVEALIKEHGENSLFVKAEKLRLGALRRRLEHAQEPRKEEERRMQVKQRQIEREIREREDRIGRACGMCEKLKQELEEYKMEVGAAASSPERNARIQAAREEQARHDRELEEAIARQTAENAASVTEIMARLQAEEAAAASAAAASAAAASAAPAKKGLFGSIFGKRGGRKTRRRARKSKKTRKN